MTRSIVLVRVAVVRETGRVPGRDPGPGQDPGPAVVIETEGGVAGAAGAAAETACRGGRERSSTVDE